MNRLTSSVALLAVAPVLAFAQPPRITNAQLQTRTAGAGLSGAMNAIVSAQTQPAWIGYETPVVPGDRQMCCYNNGAMCGCALEPNSSNKTATATGSRTVELEGASRLVVLYRVENKSIGKIRTFTPDCELSAGGLPVFWLTDVRPGESIAYLAALARAENPGTRDEQRRADGAVAAIALHADPAADQVLNQFVAANQPEWLRRKAVFWLGQARGHNGVVTLTRLLHEDPSEKVRDEAVFSLTQSKEPDALRPVIQAAHDDKSPHVRGQALFWLAQRAGKTVAESAITGAIENDPDTDVKKKAVFALTQMPESEGTPLLIHVAQANKNPAVRKQAMFWLGQSHDPRALAYFEKVLTK